MTRLPEEAYNRESIVRPEGGKGGPRMKLPRDLTPYALEGCALRPLEPGDVPAMLEMQAEVLDALPDKRWYYPSDEEEFLQATAAEEGFGYFDGERLLGFAEISPGEMRGARGYAASLGEAPEGSFDFHDVMVRPCARRRGMHAAFLRLFERMARDAGGRTIYATVDPDNAPSYRNFERAGYRAALEKPAYDGRARRYYRLELQSRPTGKDGRKE